MKIIYAIISLAMLLFAAITPVSTEEESVYMEKDTVNIITPAYVGAEASSKIIYSSIMQNQLDLQIINAELSKDRLEKINAVRPNIGSGN